MKTMTLLRYGMLAALLAGALPAPASAQFGSLKRRLKEKIVQVAVKKVMGEDSSASAGTPAAGATETQPQQARKGAPAVAQLPAGPTFDEYNLEITEQVLDRFEKALRAELARRKADGRATKTSDYEGFKAGGFPTIAPYAMLKERVFPFCAATAAAETAGSVVRIPTDFTGIYFVYTPAEIEAMKARCSTLMPLLKSVM